MKQIIVLVPMKGHSERVPNKNMKHFNGRPLYHSIINALQNCGRVKTIVINTDSKIIAEDAEKHFSKVKINWRPEYLCGDFVSMNEVIGYDVNSLDGEDHFMQTHSTNPLLTTETIDRAIDKYFEVIENGCDSVFGVTKFQSRFYWADTTAINQNQKELIRTQDLPPIYEENSNFYIFSRESFKQADRKRIGLRPYMFEVNKLEAIDIDNPEDFILAESIAKLIN